MARGVPSCPWDHRPEGARERAERGDTMPMDNWYDLAIRELSDLTDLAKEKLADNRCVR